MNSVLTRANGNLTRLPPVLFLESKDSVVVDRWVGGGGAGRGGAGEEANTGNVPMFPFSGPCCQARSQILFLSGRPVLLTKTMLCPGLIRVRFIGGHYSNRHRLEVTYKRPLCLTPDMMLGVFKKGTGFRGSEGDPASKLDGALTVSSSIQARPSEAKQE